MKFYLWNTYCGYDENMFHTSCTIMTIKQGMLKYKIYCPVWMFNEFKQSNGHSYWGSNRMGFLFYFMDWRELLYGMSHVRRLCQRCCMLPQFGGEASQQQLNNGFNPYCLSCKELAFCRSNSALLLNCANRQTEACFLQLSPILRTS